MRHRLPAACLNTLDTHEHQVRTVEAGSWGRTPTQPGPASSARPVGMTVLSQPTQHRKAHDEQRNQPHRYSDRRR